MASSSFQVKIPMVSYGIGSNSSGDAFFLKTQTKLDDGDYDGATYYFEANCWNTHASLSYEMALVNEAGDDVATLTIPPLTGDTNSHTRFRSTAFTPVSGSQIYRVRIDQTDISNRVGSFGVFIIIDQVDATKTRTPIVGPFRPGGTSQDANGYVDAHGSPFGVYLSIPSVHTFTVESTWWEGGVLTWEIEAVCKSNTGAGGDLQLWNDTDGSEVGVINWTVNAIEHKILDVSSGFGAHDVGDVYKFRHRKITSGSFFTYRAILYAKVTGGITKGRLHHFIARANSWAETADEDARELYEISKFSSGTSVKLGVGGVSFNFDPPDITSLYRGYGTTDGPGDTDGSDVVGSNVGPLLPFAIHAWVEAASDQKSLLTDGDRYGSVSRNDTSTSRFQGQVFILFDLDNPAAGAEVSDVLGDSITWQDEITDSALNPFIRISVDDDLNSPWADDVVVVGNLNIGRSVADSIGDSTTWLDVFQGSFPINLRASVGDSMNMLDDVDAIGGVFFGQNMVVLMDLELAGGTQCVSSVPVRSQQRPSGFGETKYYDCRVLKWGDVVRSIPVPSGAYRISDAAVLIADTDQKFRKLFAANSPKKRPAQIQIVPEGTDLSLAQNVYRGEIVNVTFPEGAVLVELADVTFDWLREEIPNLVVPENFDNLPQNISEVFAPIIFGHVLSLTADDESPAVGNLVCRHVDTVLNRYLVARHSIESVEAVYSRATAEDDFAEVVSGFTIVEELKTIEEIEYIFTYIQFGSAQPAGTEIRADVKGMLAIPADSAMLAERNPASNIRNYLTQIVRLADDNSAMNLALFDAVVIKADTQGYKSDGAITTQMTHGAALSRLYSSFNIDFFQDKDGVVAIDLVVTANASRPIYDDTMRILEDTVNQSLAQPIYNIVRYSFSRNYADGEWGGEETWTNETDRAIIGEDIELPMELWFVRDELVAATVGQDIGGYHDLTSYRISLDLPAPWVVPDLELARLLGVTHYGGIEASGSGYSNQEFKTIGITFNADRLRYRIDGIVRRVPPVEALGTVDGGPLSPVNWGHNARPGPYMPRTGVMYGVFLVPAFGDPFMQKSENFGITWQIVDQAGQPDLGASIRSFDSHWSEAEQTIDILTQDNLGRTAYHQFDLATDTWAITDELIYAAAGDPFNEWVSITRTRQSGKLVAFFASEFKTGPVSGAVLRRQKASIKPIGGVWSTPAFIGSDGCNGGYHGGRAVAGKEDTIHFFYMFRGSNGEGYGTERIEDRHLTYNNAEGDLGEYIRFSGNIVYYHSTLAYGGYAAEEDDDGEVLIDLPVQGFFGRSSSFPYTSDTTGMGSILIEGSCNAGFDNHLEFANQPEVMTLSNAYQGEASPNGSTRYSSIFMHKDFKDDTRHMIIPGVTANHMVYKTATGSDPPFTPWIPGGSEDRINEKAGPQTTFPRNMQKMSARMYTLNGVHYWAIFVQIGVDSTQSADLVAAGVIPGPTSQVTFYRWISTEALPDPEDFDMDAFIARLIEGFEGVP